MIKIESLNKSYSGKTVLKDISQDLEESKLICVIGPNGVGKSTLIRCMDKLINFDSGRIEVGGLDVSATNIKTISDVVAFIPNTFSDMFGITVFESVALGIQKGRRRRLNNEEHERVFSILELLGILEYRDRPISSLSAGQCQMASLARGLAQDCPVLLLDEPLSNLDINHQIFVMEMLKNVVRVTGRTIICICHDLNLSARYADKIMVLAKPGALHSYGPPDEIITSKMIADVYSVDTEILRNDGRPFVIIKGIIH